MYKSSGGCCPWITCGDCCQYMEGRSPYTGVCLRSGDDTPRWHSNWTACRYLLEEPVFVAEKNGQMRLNIE